MWCDEFLSTIVFLHMYDWLGWNIELYFSTCPHELR